MNAGIKYIYPILIFQHLVFIELSSGYLVHPTMTQLIKSCYTKVLWRYEGSWINHSAGK